MGGDPDAPADLDALGDGVEHHLALPADVARVDATPAPEHGRELHDLVGGGVQARRVHETRRKAHCARVERVLEQPLHRRHLVGARRSALLLHRGLAQGAVADERGHVQGGVASIDPLEVLAECPPVQAEPLGLGPGDRGHLGRSLPRGTPSCRSCPRPRS
jgi:hypothetical protein